MLNACPNQKMPISIMNITGRTAAASAISVPCVSPASRLKVRWIQFFILCDLLSESPDVSNAVKNHGKGQSRAEWNLQCIRVVERNSIARQPERDQRNQDVTDVPHCLS